MYQVVRVFHKHPPIVEWDSHGAAAPGPAVFGGAAALRAAPNDLFHLKHSQQTMIRNPLYAGCCCVRLLFKGAGITHSN